ETSVSSANTAKDPSDTSKKLRYSPAVLKLSQEHNIDLTKVNGSGAGGRITRKDLLTIIESGQIPTAGQQAEVSKTQATSQETTSTPSKVQVPNVPVAAGDVEIPVTGVRRAIATNMLRSKHEIPHAWTMVEVDATNMVAYRNALKNEFKQKEGFNL